MPRAISVTNPGGEVVALDTDGYGAFTIDKALTILAIPGIYVASRPASVGGDSITIAAGPNDVVRIKGFDLYSDGTGSGIVINSCKRAEISDVRINRFANGVKVNSGAGSQVVLREVTISDFTKGIWTTSSSMAKVAVSRAMLTGGSVGYQIDGGWFFLQDGNNQQSFLTHVTTNYNITATAQKCFSGPSNQQSMYYMSNGTDTRTDVGSDNQFCNEP